MYGRTYISSLLLYRSKVLNGHKDWPMGRCVHGDKEIVFSDLIEVSQTCFAASRLLDL